MDSTPIQNYSVYALSQCITTLLADIKSEKNCIKKNFFVGSERKASDGFNLTNSQHTGKTGLDLIKNFKVIG